MSPCTVVLLARHARLFCVRRILLPPTPRLWPIPAAGSARSIHSEWVRSLLFALLLNVPMGRADTSAPPVVRPLTLTAATTLALKDNPGLAQIQARSEAMAAIPSQVGTLPDPVISFNALNIPIDTFDIGQENMTQMQGGISQVFPFPGKLALREEAASHEAEAALYDVTEARWRLVRDVNKGWWALFYLDRALEIITANQALLRQFAEIARTKYEVGEGLQQDVLLAQLELSKLLDKELTFSGARNNAEARLNALLAQSANHAITVPKKVSEALPDLPAETELFRLAEEHRALLASRRQSIQAAQSRVELAEKGYYPDFKFGVYYGGRQDTLDGRRRDDFLSMKLSMNVPIFAATKQRKKVDQRGSELMERQYALQDEWNKVQADISGAYSDFIQTRNQVVLFKSGIIPQAQQTVASMLAGYQVDEVDFLNLVRSQITLYNYQTQYWRALSQANQALAQLTAVVGKEVIDE